MLLLGFKLGDFLKSYWHVFSPFSRHWTVTSTGNRESFRWFRRKNAEIYAFEMNKYSDEYFEGEKFEVVRC